jgi:hypothetical protein
MNDPNKNYVREVEITFKGEVYLVRDNGSVYRKSNPSRRRSKWDEIWTFGAQGKDGYNTVGSHKVHKIVVHSYLDAPPGDNSVVDHGDRRLNPVKSNYNYGKCLYEIEARH